MPFCWKWVSGKGGFKRLMGAGVISVLLHATAFLVVTVDGLGGRWQFGMHPSSLSVALVQMPHRPSLLTDVVQASPADSLEKKKWDEKTESPASESKSAPHEMQYYPDEGLTRRPYPITVLEVPELESGLEGVALEGRAVINVWISAEGWVVKTEKVFSDMSTVVYELTVAAYRQMRFSPAEIEGKAVGCVVTVEVSYDDFRLGVGG